MKKSTTVSDKPKFPRMAPSWALIWLGATAAFVGAKDLVGSGGVDASQAVIALAAAAVLVLLIPKTGFFLSALSQLVAVNIATGYTDQTLAGFSDVLTSSGWVMGLLLIAFGSVVASGRSFLSLGTLFIFLSNAACAAGSLYALTVLDPLVQTPLGASTFLLGIVLAFFLREKKREETASAPDDVSSVALAKGEKKAQGPVCPTKSTKKTERKPAKVLIVGND